MNEHKETWDKNMCLPISFNVIYKESSFLSLTLIYKPLIWGFSLCEPKIDKAAFPLKNISAKWVKFSKIIFCTCTYCTIPILEEFSSLQKKFRSFLFLSIGYCEGPIKFPVSLAFIMWSKQNIGSKGRSWISILFPTFL